ncbi:MAG: SDR family oxidoreductase [Bacteroidetes bacterium]|nr:SDR family oxidoreductase [Bacteroidota bacterium]
MRVFLTGATGFIGSAIVQELIGAGHQVLGLARSDKSAEALVATGAGVHRGSLEDPKSLQKGAAACDGVIHTAFIHDFSQFETNCRIDRLAIEAMGATLAGSGRPLVVTSGTATLQRGRLGKEQDVAGVNAPGAHRAPSERLALALADQNVRVSVVRLPPTVHGEGDHGFIPMIIGIARQKGVSAYIGEGNNRWPAVHRHDAARVFRLAMEKGIAGTRYHAVAEEGIQIRSVAECIGKQLGLPVVSKTPAEAPAHFGFLGNFYGADCPCSGTQTQEWLGWKPSHKSLMEDLGEAYYFKG